ncbi:hypothetical protein D3C85_1048670 [compost metagenome]
MFFRVHRDSSKLTLHNESSQVGIIINFSKYNKDICKSTIRDPHLLTIDHIMLSIF